MSLPSIDKITEIFCAADDFCKEYSQIIWNNQTLYIGDGKKHRNRQHIVIETINDELKNTCDIEHSRPPQCS